MTETQNAAKPSAVSDKQSKGFSADEKAAMKERAKELKAASRPRERRTRPARQDRRDAGRPDRVMAERIHGIVTTTAPDLWSRTWYGMPAYTKDGKIVCFFKAADKFKSRYATFEFERDGEPRRRRDVGGLLGVTKLTAAGEAAIASS